MIEIIPVEYGKSRLNESMVFYDGSESKSVPIIFIIYLIKTENHMILVDAGCETMPGFEMTDFPGAVNALKGIGVYPEDVTDVVITHAHHDHIECVKYFSNAVIHIEANEYYEGSKYIPDDFITNIFAERYTVCENVEIIRIGGHTKGSCIVKVKKDSKDYIIAGDECYIERLLDK